MMFLDLCIKIPSAFIGFLSNAKFFVVSIIAQSETSLTQIYFWLSKVTDPNLKSSGLSPRLVSLNTSLKLKGNA